VRGSISCYGAAAAAGDNLYLQMQKIL